MPGADCNSDHTSYVDYARTKTMDDTRECDI